MSKFKPCKCKNIPKEKFEYGELKEDRYFVKLKVVKKQQRQLIPAGQGKSGGWKVVTLKKELLEVTYPGYGGPRFKVRLSEADKYFLVINKTKYTAFPVLKASFAKNYEVINSNKNGSKKSNLQ